MSDLRDNYPSSNSGYNLSQAKSCLDWLASFHAAFWEVDTDGVWETGCYWHLETRPDEFEQIDGEWADLKSAAAFIDRELKGNSGKFRTLCHGDFKSANIVHTADGTKCAAYDFQYVGKGYGVKDVAYLFASSLSPTALGKEQELLQYYHEQLTSLLGDAASSYTFEVMQAHFELALLDYVRFMAGWGFWGNGAWASKRAREMLPAIAAAARKAN
jgi:Ser/Thr protein kinase RdoA (MazF antagonist)